MRLLIIAIAIAIAIAKIAARDAEACTCGPALPSISPSGNDVPIDATVMIWVQQRYAKVPALNVGVRPLGGKFLPVDIKTRTSAETSVIELVPKQSLTAYTRYEVVVERNGKQERIESFTTGTAKSTIKPAWKAQGIGRIRFVKPAKFGGGSCLTGDPHLEVVWMAAGDRADHAKLRVGVWIGTTIDLAKPPTIYLDGLRAVEKLGRTSSCASSNLRIPTDKALKVAAKLFDVAGNASDEREVVTDTTQPITEPP